MTLMMSGVGVCGATPCYDGALSPLGFVENASFRNGSPCSCSYNMLVS